MRLSMLKRFIELAHCCCDVQNLHGHVRRLRRAASTKWAWPAFDDARLLNLNKKRREADVVRCVRRCQRGEYVFAATPRSTASSGTRAS